MPDPVTGLVVGATSIGSSLIGAGAAKKAGKAQAAADQMGIEEQRAAREEMRKLLQPYVDAGTPALKQQMDFLGLNGPQAQQAFVTAQENNPLYQGMVRQGEDALLQQASATGGLRGGNTQGALAQFRPQMLNQFLEQQYGRLGGITQLGQNSAAGVGNAGLGVANSISSLFQDQGAARAGAALGVGAAWQNTLNLPAQFAGLSIANGGTGKLF